MEIDEKPLDQVEIEEKNRSASEISYYIFAFLFEVLVVAGWLRFCLVVLVGLLHGRAIVSRAIGGVVSIGGKVAVGLLGLSLWKVPISFRSCYIADGGF